jgi:hypothetical protein
MGMPVADASPPPDAETSTHLVIRSRTLSPTTDNQSASIFNIDNGKYVVVVAMCAAFCGISMAVSVWAAYTARDAATESRLVQYYLLDPHSRTPDELAAWAKFNRERETK